MKFNMYHTPGTSRTEEDLLPHKGCGCVALTIIGLVLVLLWGLIGWAIFKMIY